MFFIFNFPQNNQYENDICQYFSHHIFCTHTNNSALKGTWKILFIQHDLRDEKHIFLEVGNTFEEL